MALKRCEEAHVVRQHPNICRNVREKVEHLESDPEISRMLVGKCWKHGNTVWTMMFEQISDLQNHLVWMVQTTFYKMCCLCGCLFRNNFPQEAVAVGHAKVLPNDR